MKKWLCILVMVFFLIPTIAIAEMVTVSELYDQAQELERWTQTYVAKGRTIDVDVPIIVPDVENMPILRVREWSGYEVAQMLNMDMKPEPMPSETMIGEDPALLSYLNAENRSAKVPRVWICDPERHAVNYSFLGVECLMPSRKPRDGWSYSSEFFYPYEINAKSVYAEENPLSLADAQNVLLAMLEYYYSDSDMDAELDSVEVRSRVRNKKNKLKMDYPMGTYILRFRQKIQGIPIYATVYEKMLTTSDTKVSQDVAVQCERAGWIETNELEFMDMETFSFMSTWFRLEEVLDTDIPLASLDRVLMTIEKEIEAGHVRDIYSLRLGYCCYADEDSRDMYGLYPVWVMECSRSESATAEIMETKWDAGNFREKIGYELVLINAQTCEVTADWVAEDEGLFTPKAVTWEETQ